eukprot:188253_1
MGKEVWVIAVIAIVAAYVIFGPTDNSKKVLGPGDTPPLSTTIPSYIGPSGWDLTEAHKPYKATKIFDKSTIPRGLTSRHNTKKDVTGLIHVVKGELKLTIFANKKDIETDQIVILKGGQCAISTPQQWHKVAANTDDMQFYVEFWKVP